MSQHPNARLASRGWETLVARIGPGAGSSCPCVSVDDRSHVAYAELLPDGRKETCRAFMSSCPVPFGGVHAEGHVAELVQYD